jgi:hypothetical protein
MNGKSIKMGSKDIILRRIRLSLLLGTSITIVFGLMLNILPFSIGRILFWPALPFIKVYDEQLGAPFYYLVGLALAIPAYSLMVYIYMVVRKLPNPKEHGIGVQEH